MIIDCQESGIQRKNERQEAEKINDYTSASLPTEGQFQNGIVAVRK